MVCNRVILLIANMLFFITRYIFFVYDYNPLRSEGTLIIDIIFIIIVN